MYVRRTENLILDSRRETENEEFTDNTGIQDTEFIRYLNDAQDDLQSAIARQHQQVFTNEKLVDVVANQASYPLPDDIFLDNRIANVWFTNTGNSKDYRELHPGSMLERVFDKTQSPALYIRDTNRLILTPTPSRSIQNGLLLLYVKKLPKMDVRRAVISSVSTSGNQITSLELDVNANFDREALLEENYISVVNRDGDPVMQQIPVLDIDSNTGVVTVDSGFLFEEGETIAAGNYCVRGRFGTNRSLLPTSCERYLLSYCNLKIFKRDSSGDSIEANQELLQMRDEIVSIFQEVDSDAKTVAIKNTQFLDDDDLFIFY